MKFFARGQNGFTLVELLTVVLLLSIVSLGLWHFTHYMYESYKRSETLWIEEQAVRKVAQAVYDMAEVAYQAEILDTMPATTKANTAYIYGDAAPESSPRVKVLDAKGVPVTIDGVVLDGVFFEPKEKYPMDIIFRPAEDLNGDLLKQAVTFTLTGGRANYVLDTTIYFPNMNDKQQVVDSTALNNGGRVLAFQIWGDKITAVLKPILIELSDISCCN